MCIYLFFFIILFRIPKTLLDCFFYFLHIRPHCFIEQNYIIGKLEAIRDPCEHVQLDIPLHCVPNNRPKPYTYFLILFLTFTSYFSHTQTVGHVLKQQPPPPRGPNTPTPHPSLSTFIYIEFEKEALTSCSLLAFALFPLLFFAT